MKQRVRKAHVKSRNGCLECKKRHHKCDECYPVCGQCNRLGQACSLSTPSPDVGPALEDHTLNIDDLRLLHHWHNASEEEDFAPFIDHSHVDKRQNHNDLMELSFKHPYLLHTLLALSALHLLHRTDKADSKLFEIASAHNLSAMRLARPQIARGDAEHRDAVFNFAAFASLYATAEPPLRTGDAEMTTPTDIVNGLLDAFKMGKGVRAVQEPFIEELKASGSISSDLWKDNRDDLLPTLETDFPQLIVLSELIMKHCDEKQRQSCLDAARLLFISMAVFATNHQNHSSLKNIQTWPMDIDSICLEMIEGHHPIGLVLLAYYAALMSMRSNYWFFKRWPPLLLNSVRDLLPAQWHESLQWPSSLVLEKSSRSWTND